MGKIENKFVEDIIIESVYWSKRGVPNKVIEESLNNAMNEGFGDIFSSLGSGIWQTLKREVAGYVVSALGMDPDSFGALVVRNLFAKLSFSDYGKVFRDCEFTTKKLAEALVATLLDQLRAKVGYDDIMSTTIQNSMMEYLQKQEFIESIENSMGDKVCDMLELARKTITNKIPMLSKII